MPTQINRKRERSTSLYIRLTTKAKTTKASHKLTDVKVLRWRCEEEKEATE